MKTLSLIAMTTLCATLATGAMAAETAPLKGCAAKEHTINNEITEARAHGNSRREAGLQTALAEVKAHCTDASLRKELENKVQSAQHEVSEREADLQQANSKGDTDKIDKRKSKLAESRQELQKAQRELDDMNR